MPHSLLLICAVEQTMFRDSRHSHNVNNMIHARYITHTSSEKEAALGLPQLGVMSLADSNSWNANGKRQNCEVDSQSTEPAGV